MVMGREWGRKGVGLSWVKGNWPKNDVDMMGSLQLYIMLNIFIPVYHSVEIIWIVLYLKWQ
jgi:hypothetical protein